MNATDTRTVVKTAIENSGLSQEFIARLTGIHYSKLSRIVNEKRSASESEKRAIALVLRLPVDELFSGGQDVGPSDSV